MMTLKAHSDLNKMAHKSRLAAKATRALLEQAKQRLEHSRTRFENANAILMATRAVLERKA